MPAAGPHFDKIEPPTADDLKAFRSRHGLTAKAMASFIGVSYSVYRKWESGDVRAHPLASRVLCWIECGFVPPEFRAEKVKAHA